MQLKVIARMKSDFTTKFGLPRQSGLLKNLKGTIVFEKEYSDATAFRGLEGFSHIWIIWGFSKAEREGWSPSVKPPRLGGKKRMGVFATRSPFRPNSIGLSCVKLTGFKIVNGCMELSVEGADLMDGTPIYDIKPYLPYADSFPKATEGFAADVKEDILTPVIPDEWLKMIPEDKVEALKCALKGDPRPSYHNDPDRRYGFEFAGLDIRFKVKDNVITVCEVVRL
ncbi:MAG: tRNA (N6-threonylcarbamoyladenosine(37)-N6)-methyltransferase TrmO [Christensenellaceae bacterium]|nr:tRNA (N6-threonylcarbamoyladenosine(37)-N6)-methyltransferase TrmO [Christensenellaceae bacterium]